MSPFSENAATLFGEAVKVSRPFQWKYLKPYISIPEYQNISSRGKPLLDALRGIVYYSNQVVAINNSKLSDHEKNRKMAIYLSEVLEKALKDQKLDSLQMDRLGTQEILDNIRNAESYLDGIAAASPIVNSVVLAIQNRLDEVQTNIPAILAGFDREIEREYGATRKNFINLRQLQQRLIHAVTCIYNARLGDKSELDSLLLQNSSLHQFFNSADKVTPAQLSSAESFLLEQLHQIDVILRQLDNALGEFNAKQDEMTTWRIQLEEKIIIARNSTTIWAQSHRNLGAGIPVPPLIDVAGFASGLVGTATKTILP